MSSGGAGAPARTIDWRWILPRLLLAVPVIQLYVLHSTIRPFLESDYYLLYLHGEMARAGQTLYWPWPEYGPHYGAGGLRFPPDRIFYPPFLTPLLSPITSLGLEAFTRIWLTILWVAYWVYSACLAKLSRGSITVPATILWGIALFVLTGRASQSALNLGNVDPILWALFGAALAWPAFRGIGFMGLALVKLYGVWPLIFAGIAREWRTVRTAAATLVAVTVLVVLTIGPVDFASALLAWFRHMLPVAGQGTFSPYNVSISFLVLRLARALGWEYVAGPLGQLPRLFLTLTGIAAPLLTGWLTRRQPKVLSYAAIVCAAVFFAPLAWNFYTPLLLSIPAIWLGRRSDRKAMVAGGSLSRAAPAG